VQITDTKPSFPKLLNSAAHLRNPCYLADHLTLLTYSSPKTTLRNIIQKTGIPIEEEPLVFNEISRMAIVAPIFCLKEKPAALKRLNNMSSVYNDVFSKVL
jgi:hypothetical protein